MNLDDKLKATVLAAAMQEEQEEKSAKLRTGLVWSGVTAAAAGLALLLALPSQPKDTFDDPAMAYAQVEKAFAMISQKMETGLETAQKAEEPIETIKTYFK